MPHKLSNAATIESSHFEFDDKVTFVVGSSARKRRLALPTLPPFAAIGLGKLGRRQRSEQQKLAGTTEEDLHVSLIQGSNVEKYIWDGSKVVSVSGEWLRSHKHRHGTVAERLQRLKERVLDAFFPKAHEVTPDYWDYTKWRATHRLCSAMLQNFATQSLLAAVGVGAQRTLPTAAAINWVLKDGLGRLGRLSVATGFGQSFDSDLKRFRMTTSLLFSAAITLEYLTPLFPGHFLLLASTANVGKSMGLATYIATTPAFQKSFARNENLADLNAKGQAQSMVLDTLGLAICVGLTWAVRNRPRAQLGLPLVVLPICGLGDLTSIYNELKSVHLRIMNRERAEMIAEAWLQSGQVPTAKQICSQESLLLPTPVSNGLLPMRIRPLHELIDNPPDLATLLHRHRDGRYMLAYREARPSSVPLLRDKHARLAMCLRSDAQPRDVLTGVLQAAYFRRLYSTALQRDSSPAAPAADSASAAAGGSQFSSAAQHESSALHDSKRRLDDSAMRRQKAAVVQHALRLSHRLADAGVDDFMTQMRAREWQTQPFMLSSIERAVYCLDE